ncbi:MAG: sialate O-acetylesterase [Acidobacteriota bacterium]
MSKRFADLAIATLLLGWSGAVDADVAVPSMFSDHAVLQRGIAVPVWGTAGPGEAVTVEFGGQTKATTADGNGRWMVYLDPMQADSSSGDLVITGNNVILVSDVQVGDVYLGSGQSNMQRPLSDDCDAAAAIADAPSYNMRFFNVTASGGNVASTVWEVSDTNSAPAMSAVHFYFGRHLAQHLPDVPIGLITSAVGATAIERWATCAGSGKLYTGQIVPLQPYALRGVTWYQGEWDARGSQDSSKYYWQLPCLIEEWRADWGQGAFPFYVVQMPKMGISSIHIVRDAELQTTLNDPQVEMIVTIDQPGSDVHPPCKDPFGIRLATLARKLEYGQDVVARSPLYNAGACYVDGNTIGVVFDHVADGLQSSGGELAEWEVAGANGNYVAATASIVGTDTVEVWSASIPIPVSARYAFSTNPADNNLVNSAGLPASPIREVAPDPTPSLCGDGFCDPGEDPCTCADDCGPPPLAEAICDDGVDNDCDLDADCFDIDCELDPVCAVPPTDCSQYTDKRSCNGVFECRWDNRNKVCLER